MCLRALPGGPVILQAAPGQRRGMLPGGSKVVIEGFTLRGFAAGISFWTGRGRTQRRVTVERVRVEQPASPLGEGIVAYGDNRQEAGAPPVLDGLLLLDVEVDGVDLGISCNAGPCQHWWIERTRVHGRAATTHSGVDAFAVEQGRQIVLLDSLFTGVGADGIDTKATDVVVFGCRVQDVTANGIKLWHGGDVIDSAVVGTGQDAALVGSHRGRYRYLHLLLARHGEGGSQYVGTWGYDSHDPVELEIINSIFTRNATGGFYIPAGSRISLRHNLFDDGRAKLADLSDGQHFRVAELGRFEKAGFGKGNRIGDPRLGELAKGSFAPAAGSPARDAGEVVPGLVRDLLGRPRQSGPAPDLGPVEAGP